MELSMWMIANALARYPCKTAIRDGHPVIRGARFLSQMELPSPELVYIEIKNEIGRESVSQEILLTNQDDVILIEDGQPNTLNDLLGLFDRYNHWEAAAEIAQHNAQTLQLLLDCAAEIFQTRVWVIARGGQVCASLHSTEKRSLFYSAGNHLCMRSEILRQISLKAQKAPFCRSFSVPELSLCCRDLYDGPHRVGILFMEYGPMEETCLLQLGELLGSQIEHWLALHPDRKELPRDGSILQPLLSPHPDDACISDFEAHLQSVGWQDSDRKILYLVKAHRGRSAQRMIESDCALFPAYVFTEYGDQAVVLVNHTVSGDAAVSGVWQRILARGNCTVGASYPFTTLKELYQALQQANLALSVGQSNSLRICQHYLPEYICFLVRQQTSSNLAHPALAVLQKYDDAHHTQMLETLALYLFYERNQKLTAEALSLHRNSLFYRLSKIQELCTLNLDDPATRLQLLLSFVLYAEDHNLPQHTELSPHIEAVY